MNHKVVNELNTVLKGEEMAVEAYEKFIKDLNDLSIIEKFKNIHQDHKKHAADIASRIQELGGQPKYGLGAAGVMANVKAAVENIVTTRIALDIVKEAYDGEDKGIAKVEEIVKGDLDKESQTLINGILSTDHQHLRDMAKIISDYELKH